MKLEMVGTLPAETKLSKTFTRLFGNQKAPTRSSFRCIISSMADAEVGPSDSQLRQSFAMEEYGTIVPSNYDVTVPVTLRGNYRNSIEVFNLMELEESSKSDDQNVLRFPDLMTKTVVKSTATVATQSLEKTNRDFSILGKFNLEVDAKRFLSFENEISEIERRTMKSMIMFKCKHLSREEFETAKYRYILKKKRRKMTYQIRYKVRQDLAVKRQRNKGKFVKSRKIDIRAAVGMLLKQEEAENQKIIANRNSLL